MFGKKVVPRAVATSIELVSSFTSVDRLWAKNALRFAQANHITDPARISTVAFPYKDNTTSAAAKRVTFATAITEYGTEQVLTSLSK